jgi:DNA-binding SARP family transcriptional activator
MMAKSMVKAYNVLKIQMFGDFKLECDGKVLSIGTGRSRQVWSLLEFLLIHRKSDFSVDTLIEALWEDEIENPYNALKNLVYRLRTLLSDSLGVGKEEYVIYKHGSYAWNTNASYELDIDKFENAYKLGLSPALSDLGSFESFLEASELYTGNLLSHSAYKEWIMPLAVYYQNMYMDCIDHLCEYLFLNKGYHKIEALCLKAISIDALVERNHEILINCYIASNNIDKAMSHYYYVSKLFYKELGIKLSPEIDKLYQTLIDRENSDDRNMTQIKHELTEAELNQGAVYCDYESFKLIYRVNARAAIRSGKSVYLILLNFAKSDNTIFQNFELKDIADICELGLINSLRKDDIVTRYNRTEYLILLSNINYENAEKVLQKLINKIKKVSIKNNLKITTQLETLDPIELASK